MTDAAYCISYLTLPYVTYTDVDIAVRNKRLNLIIPMYYYNTSQSFYLSLYIYMYI